MYLPRGSAGLVINTHMLKIIEINRVRRKNTITAYGSMELDRPLLNSKNPADTELLIEKIRELLIMSGVKTKTVTIGLTSRAVIMRLAAFPDISDDALFRNMVALHAKDFIPVPVLDFQIGYMPCGKAYENGTVTRSTLIAASQIALLNTVVDAAISLNFKLNDITPTSSALIGAFIEQNAVKPGTYMVVINADNMSDIFIVKNGAVIFARSSQIVRYKETVPANKTIYPNSILNGIIAAAGYYSTKLNPSGDTPLEAIYTITESGLDYVNETANFLKIPVKASDMFRGIPCVTNTPPNGYEDCISLII